MKARLLRDRDILRIANDDVTCLEDLTSSSSSVIATSAHVKPGGTCPPSSAVTPSTAVGVGDRELFVQPLRAEVERGSRVRHRIPEVVFLRRQQGRRAGDSKEDDESVAMYNVSEETMSGKEGTMDGKESEATTNESERNAPIFCSLLFLCLPAGKVQQQNHGVCHR